MNEIYLKTNNTTKASHLTLGNVMFRVTRQARIVDTSNLEEEMISLVKTMETWNTTSL